MVRIDGNGKGNSRRDGPMRLPSDTHPEGGGDWMSEADRAKHGLPPGPVPIAADPTPKEATTPMAKRLTDAEKEALKFDLQRGDMTQRSLSLKYGVAQSVISYYAGLVKTLPESMSDAPRDADDADTPQDIGCEDDGVREAELSTSSEIERALLVLESRLTTELVRVQQHRDEIQIQLDAVRAVQALVQTYADDL